MQLSRLAFRLFSGYASQMEGFFPELRVDLKRAGMKISSVEYLANALMIAFFVFLATLPILSFVLGFFLADPLFSFLTAITFSLFATIGTFFIYLNYPKTVIRDREKALDRYLPFAALYLSTVMSSKLPLHQGLKIFSKFSGYEAVAQEVNKINEDVDLFGLDINTALERAIIRCPSRKFRELLYGILATIRSGGNLHIYLKEKAQSYMLDYRRKLSEFAHSMTIYTEIYLTAVILGAVFFTILTSIMVGIAGGSTNVVGLQFFLIFIFIPLISMLFMYMVKAAQPGGE